MSEGAPTTKWLVGNSKWLIAAALFAGALLYVVDQVNPETICNFKLDQQKQEYRWCFVQGRIEECLR